MKNQKELKKEIQSLGDELRELRGSLYKDKAYIKYSEMADKRLKKLREKIEPEEEKLNEKLIKLRKELEDKRLSGKLQLSEKLTQWLRQYMSGIDWGYKNPVVVWHSDDERFVILTHPGGTTGQGTVMGSGGYYYSPSDHTMIDTELDSGGRLSSENKLGYKIGNYVEGRLTKIKKQELFNMLEKYKKENKI